MSFSQGPLKDSLSQLVCPSMTEIKLSHFNTFNYAYLKAVAQKTSNVTFTKSRAGVDQCDDTLFPLCISTN